MITGKGNIKSNKVFKFSSDQYNKTRGSSLKLYKPRLNKSILQSVYFFSNHEVYSWQALPENVISASTINTFKNRLACLVVNPIKVNNFAYLFDCTTVGRVSD